MADVSQNVDGVEVETVFSTTNSSGSHQTSGDGGNLATSNKDEVVSDDILVKALQDITCNLDENGLKKATELYSGNGNENYLNPKVNDHQNGDTENNVANLLDNPNGSSSSSDMISSELFKELPDCQLHCLKEDGYVAAISVCIGILKQYLGTKYEKYESVCKSFFNGVIEQDVYDEEIRECLPEEAYEYHNQLVFCILKDALNFANTDSSETLAENTDFTKIFKLLDGKTPQPAPRSRDNVSLKREVKVESQDDEDDDEVVMIKKSKRKKPNRIIDDEDDEDETIKEVTKVPRWSSANDAISQDTSASGTKRKKRKLMIYSDDEDEPDAAFDTLSFHSNANNDDEEEEEVVKRIDVKSTGLLKTTLTISRNPARDSTNPNSARNGKNIKNSSSILDQLLSSDKPISLLPSISTTNAKSALQSSQTTLDSYFGKPPLPALNNKKDVQPKGNSSSTTNTSTTNITKNTLVKSSLLKQSLTSTIKSTTLNNGTKNTVKRQKNQNSIQVNNVSSISNSSDSKSGTSLLSKKVPPVKFPENAKIKQLLRQTLCSTKQQAASTASQPSNSSTETRILRLDTNDNAKSQGDTPSLINGTNGEVRKHHNEIKAYNNSMSTCYEGKETELINPLREPDEPCGVEERFVSTLLKPTMYTFEPKEFKRGSLDQCEQIGISLLPKGIVPPVKLEEDVKPPSDMYLEVTSMDTSALVNQFGGSDLLPSALDLGHRVSQVCLLHDIKMVDKRVFDVATHSLRKLLKNIISRMIAVRSSSSMKRSPSDEFTSNLDAELYPKNPPALFRKLVERQVRQSDRRKYGTLKSGLTFSRLDQATFNAKEKTVISLYRPNSGPLYTPEEQPAIYDKGAGVRFFYSFLKNNRALVPVHGVWSRAVRRAAVALDNLEEGEEEDGTSMPFDHRSIAQLRD